MIKEMIIFTEELVQDIRRKFLREMESLFLVIRITIRLRQRLIILAV